MELYASHNYPVMGRVVLCEGLIFARLYMIIK